MARLAKKLTKKSYIAAAIAALAIIVGIFLLVRSHSKQAATTIPSTTPPAASKKPSSSSNAQNSTSTGSSPSQPDKTAANTTGSGTGPVKPFGDFVSNHIPGGSNPTAETSVCDTSPGTSCYIKFNNTNNGTVKQLAVQTTDSSGSTIWNWDVKDAGFSEGSWQVSAVATLNGQTQTTQDLRLLQISP